MVLDILEKVLNKIGIIKKDFLWAACDKVIVENAKLIGDSLQS
jgi:hypothetical protein